MNNTEDVEVPGDSAALLDVFEMAQSDAEVEAYIEFKNDNTYVLKYKLDDFKIALKEYYKEVYNLFKGDKELFEITYNMDFVVITTMMINSHFNTYEDVVDSFEETNANSIDEMCDALTIAAVVPAIQDGYIEGEYIVARCYKYEAEGEGLKVWLDNGEAFADMSFDDQKIAFSSAPEKKNAEIFKNGLLRVK